MNIKNAIYCTAALFVLSYFGCVMILIRRFYTGKYVFLFLVWNLFLAWIPLVSALILNIVSFSERRALKIILFPILLILWVIFFPNAPYMITDFIHFKNNGTFLIWYDLVIYAIFIWTGFFLGFVSLHLVKITIDRVVNRIVSWTMVVGVLFLSSYAIYIGRFIRHNSWEAVFNPFGIFLSFIKNLSIQSLVFSSVFSALLFLTYAFLYALTYLRDTPPRYNSCQKCFSGIDNIIFQHDIEGEIKKGNEI